MASKQQEICPDPSVHDHGAKLQDQASKAALYVTHPEEKIKSPQSTIPALGPDGKLSSAGAAASLKYAKPQDLPSFPSVGIETRSSGNTAANLATSSHKEFEHWKPELSSSAGKAALLAHKDGGKLNLWQPTASQNGFSAAGIAMKTNSSPQLDYGYTDEGRKRALLAATQSLKPKQAAPASTPKYPDAANSAANALNAAATAHRPAIEFDESAPLSDPANEASRITHLTNVPREMFGEHPPLQLDAEEKKKQDALTAAKLMNKKQLDDAQKLVLEQKAAKAALEADIRNQAKNYLTLQSEAQKLADERLSKLDPDREAAYREHWGYGDSSPKRIMSLRRKGTEKNKDADEDDDDAARAGRIRHQMRRLGEDVQSADDKKKLADREKLRLAAEKSVKDRMKSMDEQVFMDTGKYSPAMMEEWERQARIKANANVEERMKHYGKVHIGGGKFMDQAEIDAIAQGRMQPTLDEITESAEKQRARDEEIRLDQEQRKLAAATEKARDQETKDEIKRQKAEEKAAAKAEKDADKARKNEEKELAKTQRRLEKEEARQYKEQRKAQDAAFAEEQKHAREASQPNLATEETITADDAPVAAIGGAGAAPAAAAAGATEASQEPKDPIKDVHTPAVAVAQDDTIREDPPGVPTSFGEGATADAIVASEPQRQSTSTDIAARQDKDNVQSKRSSRLGGIFGKFKRSSRQPGSISSLETTSTGKVAVEPAAATGATGVASTAISTEDKGKSTGPADNSADVSPLEESERTERAEPKTVTVQDASKMSFKERFSGILGSKKARDSGDDEDFVEAREEPETAAAATRLAAPEAESKRASSVSPAPGESRFHEEL